MPWVCQYRDRLREKRSPNAAEWLSCEWCKEHVPTGQRETLGCGWLADASEKACGSPFGPEPLPGWDWRDPYPTICAGYTSSLPEVLEAARALSWRKDGQLAELYDDHKTTQALRDAMDIVDVERSNVERFALKRDDDGTR